MTEKTIHQGRNVKRFREMLGIKQDALAFDLGLSQQAVSTLEQREALDKDILKKISEILKVPADAIENFDEEAAINIISNVVNNNDHATGNSLFSYYPTINPIEKWMEALEENKRLYEARLKDKDETITMLQKLVEKK